MKKLLFFTLAVSILIVLWFLTADIAVASQESQNRQVETAYVDVTSCNAMSLISSDENYMATPNEKSLVVLNQFIGAGSISLAEMGRAAPGDQLTIVRNNYY